MPTAPTSDHDSDDLSQAFYVRVMTRLTEAGVPFLVGGAFALARFTGLERNTKDFDIFVRREDIDRTLAALSQDGCRTELTFPHWLGKATFGDDFVDIIFSSGNAVAHVDDEWFQHAPEEMVLGMRARLSPPEEMIWSKAFIMERERYDGADVMHVILRCGEKIDWARLLRRFGEHWRVLFAHLVLFNFIYPGEHTKIPAWVMEHLTARLQRETREPLPNQHICRGPLLSRAQYLIDIQLWGYKDARRGPNGVMSDDEVKLWTQAIHEPKADPHFPDPLA
jgi:Nucleotidyl transferase of unknown function (DUF2204)